MKDLHPYLRHDGVLAFAHRGGALEAPENTMKAFQYAVDLGYAYVETDAYATRDGVLLAFHDDRLDRVTDRKGVIADLDYETIRGARIGGSEPIPLLEELLTTWPALKINIDPKHDGAVEPLIALLKRLKALDRVCIGSFSDKRIARVRDAFGPAVCTSMGPKEVARFWLAKRRIPVGRFGANCAQIPVKQSGVTLVDAAAVRAAKRLGLQIHVWTIDDEGEMRRLIALGVDGIMTDRPSLLRGVLKSIQ
ncbi:Glycerophosphodiester phosphodiesterase [Alphaproteobacteria bacterium SO-S41]|nr:Glycerophosphodiester phosphodiesterase [Alphaproteobacteria bacterium SO-S41]